MRQPGSIVNVQRPAPAGSHWRDPQARHRHDGRRAVAGRPRSRGRRSLPDFLPQPDRRLRRPAAAASGFTTNGRPAATVPFARATVPAQWPRSTGATSSPSSRPEVIETRMPLVVETSRPATDSGGAGTTRGGLSMQRSMRVLAPDSRYSLLSDGAVVPAFGVMGGSFGRAGLARGSRPDGAVEGFDTPGKIAGHPVGNGSVVVVRSAGGGGYGDPLLRAPARVREGCGGRAMSRAVRRAISMVWRSTPGASWIRSRPKRSAAVCVNLDSP